MIMVDEDPFKNRTFKVYAVDFDGTITISDEFPDIGEVNLEIINKLITLKDNGDKIILWTSRNGDPLDQAVNFMKDKFGLEFDAINKNIPGLVDQFDGPESRKIFADYYIDDKMLSIQDFINR